jgi:hypothetical protein
MKISTGIFAKGLFALILTSTLPVFAHLAQADLDPFLIQEMNNPESNFNLKLQQTLSFLKLNQKPEFIFNEPGFSKESPMDTYSECHGGSCVLSERKFFTKISSVKYDFKNGQVHQIHIYFLETVVSSFEKWETDLNGVKLNKISEVIKVSGIYIL